MAKKMNRPAVKIAVVNDKGGAGKTTVCIMLAQYLGQAGHNVLVHDTDVSGSAVAWGKNAEYHGVELPYKVCDSNSMLRIIEEHGPFDFIVVDTPTDAKAEQHVRSLAAEADYMLIPIQPGSLELDRMKLTLNVLREASIKEGLQLGFILNRFERTKITRGTLGYLEENGYVVVAQVPRRTGYQESFGQLLPAPLLQPAEDALRALKVPVRKQA